MITTSGYGAVVGGVILFDETFRQSYEGRTVPAILEGEGVVMGVKVDAGLVAFGGSKVEQVGKDELRALVGRMEEYAAKGVRFTKFRVVGNIGGERGEFPSDACLAANAELLAGYAEICHRFGVVPIVEPEVPMEGNHSMEQCRAASERFLKATFAALARRKIFLPGVILKTNMVLAGTEAPKANLAYEVAITILTLAAALPAEVGAVVFLSGGQSTEDGMKRLEAMRNAAARDRLPYAISSSFSRALQGPALEEFGAAVREGVGAEEVKRMTQLAFAKTLILNEVALKRSPLASK